MQDNNKKIDVLDLLRKSQEKKEIDKPMSIGEYLELCKKDKMAYATAAERLLKAIGKPELINTRGDSKLSKVFRNETIERYDAFKDFYGMENAITQVVGFLKKSAQGLEESKQVLYLLGPVGSAKSTLADKLTTLMQKEPIYTLRCKKTKKLSPVQESPLGLLSDDGNAEVISDAYGIGISYLKNIKSPWATKRLAEAKAEAKDEGKEFNPDDVFEIVKVYPSAENQIGVARVEPADENTQNISDLVGKLNINALGEDETLEEDDTDLYSYSGGLCKGNRGLMEFVEMFKAPIKTLNPLLAATQEGKYNGTQSGGSIPFDGIILAHSNESEWNEFAAENKNEAFLDRICIVKVPYSLRVTEEVKIYEKMIRESRLPTDMDIAPETLEIMARFSVLTRLKEPANSNLYSKMRVYDGENLKSEDPNAKTITDYKKDAKDAHEGMSGWTPREAFKTLSETFNANVADKEPNADPVKLMMTLSKIIERSDEISRDKKDYYASIIAGELEERYYDFLEREIKEAFLDDADGFAQNMFDKYYEYAKAWLSEEVYVEDGMSDALDLEALDDSMYELEVASNIANPRDFRQEFVTYASIYKGEHNGKLPRWNHYKKIKDVIEKKMFSTIDDILPVISFGPKGDNELEEKHGSYVKSMMKKKYSKDHIKNLSGWFARRKPTLSA